MIVGKIESGLERGFVKHRPNCRLITDPRSLTILLSPGSSTVSCCDGLLMSNKLKNDKTTVYDVRGLTA